MAYEGIKVVKCPVLNRDFRMGRIENSPPLEVVLKFENSSPKAIMCPEYDLDSGKCKVSTDECIYSHFKYFPSSEQ